MTKQCEFCTTRAYGVGIFVSGRLAAMCANCLVYAEEHIISEWQLREYEKTNNKFYKIDKIMSDEIKDILCEINYSDSEW